MGRVDGMLENPYRVVENFPKKYFTDRFLIGKVGGPLVEGPGWEMAEKQPDTQFPQDRL